MNAHAHTPDDGATRALVGLHDGKVLDVGLAPTEVVRRVTDARRTNAPWVLLDQGAGVPTRSITSVAPLIDDTARDA